MKIIRGIKSIKRQFRKPVVTIGVFDGVHLGHKRIFSALTKRAREIKGTSVAITFDPHPAGVLRPGKTPPLLISLEHRIRLIKQLNVHVLILLKFTKAMSGMTAEGFMRNILVERIGVKELLAGKDFVFGRDKKGMRSALKRLAKIYGFKLNRVSMARSSGTLISSTRIRSLIIEGKIGQASKLLGRPVSVLGTVKRGARRGRILGYPTANIDPHHEAIPPSGVYAVRIKYKKKTYGGVLNIGRRPTFYRYSDPTIEAHIFDFKGSIYDRDLEIEFVTRVRDERKFGTRSELIRQIRLDEAKSRKALRTI